MDDVAVVDDLMEDVDRRSVIFERLLDDLDGSVYSSAESAGVSEANFHVSAQCSSETWFRFQFGTSTMTSELPSGTAWQAKRELASRPGALSS